MIDDPPVCASCGYPSCVLLLMDSGARLCRRCVDQPVEIAEPVPAPWPEGVVRS